MAPYPQIRVLILEDNPADAELLVRKLRLAKYDPQWSRVETEEEYLNSLNADLDLILSDFTMPGFNGLRALELLKEKRYDIPFIMVSGSIGEDTAVAAIKQGSTDYLLKDRLGRFAASVKQALEHHKLRRESQQAEETLRLAESRYRTLFDCAPDGIFITELNGRFIDYNASICRMLGYSVQEMTTLTLADICIQPDIYESLSVTKLEDRLERQFKRKDGSLFWADIIASFMPDGHLLAMVRDVSERRRSEERITEQAALLDHARDAIIVRSLGGAILFWSKGAERVYGWKGQDIANHNITTLFQMTPSQLEEANKLLINQGEFWSEFQHIRKDGDHITIESRGTLIRDENGQPKSVLMINTDITERKKIESQLMRAQRMESIGTLAGGIAHDLNNILAPIVLSIELLKHMSRDPDALEVLDTIEGSARRGAEIVRQVLSFARGLSGERLEVRPKQLVKELSAFIKDTFPKNVRIKYVVPDNAWSLVGDPTQINQILLNLCVNARDAMPDGGILRIAFENVNVDKNMGRFQVKPGRFVAIVVTDTGMGIPKDIAEKIFEPFFTTKEVGRGTGLGLSTVLALVKSHGGFVNVESEPGRGTTFKVCIPANEATLLEAAPIKNERPKTVNGAGKVILIVDDEPSILAITSQTLESFGYHTLTARNGAEALTVYEQHKEEVAAVLTDLAMPVMDGAATIRALRAISPQLKIIAASGLRTEFPECQFFISKPYSADELRQALDATFA